MFLDVPENTSGAQQLSVVVITKDLQKGYYDSRDYNVFTSNLDKILTTSIGKSIDLPMSGAFIRLSDTVIGGQKALVFENRTNYDGNRYYIVDLQEYYYVIFYNHSFDSIVQPILTTFQFE